MCVPSSRIPFQNFNNPTSTTLQIQKKITIQSVTYIYLPLPSFKSAFSQSTDQQHTNLDLHIKKKPKIIIPLPLNTTQVSRAPKKFTIPKNHNNTSIPKSIQFQTSPITVENLRDQNIALKINNSQKLNQTLPNIPHSVVPTQTVERNKKSYRLYHIIINRNVPYPQ